MNRNLSDVETTFVIVWKKNLDVCIWLSHRKRASNSNFSQPFLTKTNGSFSQRENVWRTGRSTRVRLSVASRATSSRRARGHFM